MRETYHNMSRSILIIPQVGESGYPPSPNLLHEISTKEQELENFRASICAEIEGRWQKGHRKEIEDKKKEIMQKWGSLLELKKLD